jgi:hypothetical protein
MERLKKGLDPTRVGSEAGKLVSGLHQRIVEFYAAFLAICAAHEFLCYEWERNCGLYPLDSAVMVRSRQSRTVPLIGGRAREQGSQEKHEQSHTFASFRGGNRKRFW